MHIVAPGSTGSQLAELEYHVVRQDKKPGRQADKNKVLPSLPTGKHWASILEVKLLTGRKHQIRVQLAHAGLPIVGDRKYGSSRPFPDGIALHACRLVFMHPVSKIQLFLEAPLPASWQGWFA
jgi:23S rRNA pseudouridine1911/1915/1917 synthase